MSTPTLLPAVVQKDPNTGNLLAPFDVPNGVVIEFLPGSTLKADAGAILIGFPTPITPPGGADKQAQFNDGGIFGTDTNFTYDKLVGLLKAKILGLNQGGVPSAPGQILATAGNGLYINSGQGSFSDFILANPNSTLAQIYILHGQDNPYIRGGVGDMAPAGYIGEQVTLDVNFATPVAGGISQTSSVVTNLGSLSLSPGHWMLSGLFGFSWPVGVTVTGLQFGIMNANNVINGVLPGGINRETITYASSQTYGTVYEKAMTTMFVDVPAGPNLTVYANALTYFSGAPNTSNAVCLVTATRYR